MSIQKPSVMKALLEEHLHISVLCACVMNYNHNNYHHTKRPAVNAEEQQNNMELKLP